MKNPLADLGKWKSSKIRNNGGIVANITPPDEISVKYDYIKVGDKFHRIMAAVGYPPQIDPGWLTRLIEMTSNFNLAMCFKPIPNERAVEMLTHELKKQKTDIFAYESASKIVPQALINQHNDTIKTLQKIQRNYDQLVDMSLYIDTVSYDLDELGDMTSRMKSELTALDISPMILKMKMAEGMRTMMLNTHDFVSEVRTVPTSSAAASFPFGVYSLENKEGVLIGFEQGDGAPVQIDPWDSEYPNPNVLILGKSGVGKSATVKLFVMREFMEGADINIIDPQSEYTGLVSHFGGCIIRFAPDSESTINVMDPMGMDIKEKKLSLLVFFRMVGAAKTPTMKAVLEEALDEVYSKPEIPTLKDVYGEVGTLLDCNDALISKAARHIRYALREWVSGSMSFMDRPTNVEDISGLVSFDVRDVPEIGRPMIMYLLLSYITQQMRKSTHRKILVVDEAWSILSEESDAKYIFKIVKTCRKFNLSLVLITQDIEDLMGSAAGRAVMTNTSIKFVLRQDKTVVRDMAKMLHLNDIEIGYLKSLDIGEALVVTDLHNYPIKIVPSDFEYRFILSGPEDEIPEDREEHQEKSKFNPNLNLYVAEELKNPQIDVLKSRGFTEGVFKHIADGSNKLMLFKNYTNSTSSRKESDGHFVLRNQIFNYLEKIQATNVRTGIKGKPDCEFTTAGGQRVGVEVVGEENSANKLKKKVTRFGSEYESWFFVPTSEDNIESCKDYGHVVPVDKVCEALGGVLSLEQGVEKKKERVPGRVVLNGDMTEKILKKSAEFVDDSVAVSLEFNPISDMEGVMIEDALPNDANNVEVSGKGASSDGKTVVWRIGDVKKGKNYFLRYLLNTEAEEMDVPKLSYVAAPKTA